MTIYSNDFAIPTSFGEAEKRYKAARLRAKANLNDDAAWQEYGAATDVALSAGADSYAEMGAKIMIAIERGGAGSRCFDRSCRTAGAGRQKRPWPRNWPAHEQR